MLHTYRKTALIEAEQFDGSDEIDAELFTESELEQLKTDNPHLAPAIDAMKEPAEDKDE